VKLPKKIKAIGSTYNVAYHKSLSDVDISKQTPSWGQFNPAGSEIRVFRNGQCRQDTWDTIWHEIFHIIEEKFCIEEIRDHKRREQIIGRLATGVNAILWDNKWDFSRGK